MSDVEVMKWALSHFYHLDMANARIHCADVRFSPITFRLAECISNHGHFPIEVQQVMHAKDQYAEDKGR